METQETYEPKTCSEMNNTATNVLLGELTNAINVFQLETGYILKGVEVENKNRPDGKVVVKRLHLDLSNLWRGE